MLRKEAEVSRIHRLLRQRKPLCQVLEKLAHTGTVRLSEADLVTLREHILELVRQAQEKPDDEGIWTRVVVTLVELQDRGQPTNRGDRACEQ